MILPIVAYGDPVLKKRAIEITPEHPNLEQIIANMYESMYGAFGVGLAAPQIGLSIRLFLVDTAPFSDDESYSSSFFDGSVRRCIFYKDVKIPTLITFVSYWVIGFPTSYFLGKAEVYGSTGIWIGLLVGLGSASIFLYLRFIFLTNRLIQTHNMK